MENLKDCKNIAIVYRIHTPQAVSYAKKLTRWLQQRDYRVFTAPEQKVLAGTQSIKSKTQWDKIDLMIVLGGDGTYLRAVRLLGGRQIPILGFNMGFLGFLTVHGAQDVFSVLEKTLAGKMTLHPRTMMTAKIYRKKKLKAEFHALNDLVLERGSYSQLITISIHSDKFLANTIKADGLIISTPTGSTAYNLAAGGPILHPELEALVVTAIAPHSLTSRPFIFPDKKQLTFRLMHGSPRARLVIDGQTQFEITKDDEIRIRRSPYDHWVLRSPDFNYFHLLREKLKFGLQSGNS